MSTIQALHPGHCKCPTSLTPQSFPGIYLVSLLRTKTVFKTTKMTALPIANHLFTLVDTVQTLNLHRKYCPHKKLESSEALPGSLPPQRYSPEAYQEGNLHTTSLPDVCHLPGDEPDGQSGVPTVGPQCQPHRATPLVPPSEAQVLDPEHYLGVKSESSRPPPPGLRWGQRGGAVLTEDCGRGCDGPGLVFGEDYPLCAS